MRNESERTDAGIVADSQQTLFTQSGSRDGAYERALSSLSLELTGAGLLELTVWRYGGTAICALDRAAGGEIQLDICDASTFGRPEGRAILTREIQCYAESVTLPITFEERVLGALSARFSTAQAAQEACPQIGAAAERLAALLEVTRLSRRYATVSQDWETVVTALQSIAGGTDLHAICDAVRCHLARAIRFDCFVVARTVAENNELEAFYLYENGIPREVSIRLSLASESPGPLVATSGRTLIFRHTSDWGRFGASQVDKEAAPGDLPASALFVPLKSGQTTLGVVSIQAERPGAFGDREQALLEPIGEGLALAIARSSLQHASDDARVERGVILEVARALAQDLHPARVFEEICRQTRRLVDSPDIYIALATSEGAPLRTVYRFFNDTHVPLTVESAPSPRMLDVFHTGTPIICNSREEMAAIGVEPRLRPDLHSVAIVPLRTGNRIVGVLHCGSPRQRAYPSTRADLLIAIGEQAGVAVTNARMYEEAAERSNRDPLTNLLNHRAVMVSLQRLLAERSEGVAVVLLDVEAFRLFNTTFGHHIGDEALRLVARCIRATVREGDLAARYGGDEFLVVLSGGGAAAAGAFLEHLRAELLATPLDSPSGVPIPIAFCAGVASTPDDGATREVLVAAADERMQAERHGTNARTSHASGRSLPTLTDVQEGLLVAILRKDLYTRAHIHFVGEMALDFAEALGLDREMTHALFLGSLLHDVGKICIPDGIISKPSSLTPVERKVMERHTILGFELVRGIEGMELASLAVLHHHERMDGHGYMFGLAGDAIPPIARMVTIIDAFSAMVLDRPYHKAISDDAARAELLRCAGTQFDAEYVSVFCRLFEA